MKWVAFTIAIFTVCCILVPAVAEEYQIHLTYAEGRCLDVEGEVKEGNRLIVFECHGENNQRFLYFSDDLSLRIFSDQSLCLEVLGGGGVDYAPVIVARCSGSEAQRWVYDPQNLYWSSVGMFMARGNQFGAGRDVNVVRRDVDHEKKWVVDIIF